MSILPADPLKVGDVVPAPVVIKDDQRVVNICDWMQDSTLLHATDVNMLWEP